MSRKTTDFDRPYPQVSLGKLVAIGLTAGFLGVAVMTAGEKVEQALTKRPNSEVPGLTLARLIGRSDGEKGKLNLVMHYGQGALLGVVRAFMATHGMRGPFVDFILTGMRLSVDQTLENWVGSGALPWTWPVSEQVIDILHKGVFAFATGYVSICPTSLVLAQLTGNAPYRSAISGCNEKQKCDAEILVNE
uniref:Uncharacterized protein n=1 Tax=Kwoniella bestiolae CBS 10118 TaxID=1296100 RepID=A0A1B9FV83_9TREE|nr:hypothetical protein I302_08340 [Kwoniella bestiolae CBS 10118]OCF22689.1 hypothetical protein I302_08340 [Kwoniella bestiolae CBS 10118]